jgi:hypothetical protein
MTILQNEYVGKDLFVGNQLQMQLPDGSGSVFMNATQLNKLVNSIVPASSLAYTPIVDSSSYQVAAYNAYRYIINTLSNGIVNFKYNATLLSDFNNVNVWFPTSVVPLSITTPAQTTSKTPNVDTIYQAFVFDTTTGPIAFDIPATTLGYWSFQFFNSMWNSDYILSQRTIENSGLSKVVLAGPGQAVNAINVIRMNTFYGAFLIRAGIQGQVYPYNEAVAFLNAVKANVSAAVSPTPNTSTAWQNVVFTGGVTPGVSLSLKSLLQSSCWERTLQCAQQVLTDKRYMPRCDDLGILRKMSVLKLGPGFDSSWNATSYLDSSGAIISGLTQAINEMRNGSPSREITNKWYKSQYNNARFYQDYSYSSYIGFVLPYSLPYDEVNYYQYYDSSNTYNVNALPQYSDGSNTRYQMRFTPPTDFSNADGAFWSVTMYQYNDPLIAPATYSGNYTLTLNNYYDARDTSGTTAIGRYAIQNYTDASGTYIDASGNTKSAAPVYNLDGSITIYMSPTEPFDLVGNSLKPNWIPMPNPVKWGFTNNYFSTGNVGSVWIRFYYPPPSVQTTLWDPAPIIPCDGTWTTV